MFYSGFSKKSGLINTSRGTLARSWVVLLALLSGGLIWAGYAGAQYSITNFQKAVTNSDMVTIPQSFTFPYNHNAITVGHQNTYIHAVDNGFGTIISGTMDSLTTAIASQKTVAASDLVTWVQAGINTVAKSSELSNMISISGDGNPREVYSSQNNPLDRTKWIDFIMTNSGLGLVDLSFQNLVSLYTYPSAQGAGVVVNPVFGNNQTKYQNISFGNIKNNEFKEITVTFVAQEENKYLAGGGIIGLRAINHSTTAGEISNNYFHDLSVSTKNAADTCSTAQCPYLEGGGVIGINGVSSP
ncbi:MAG: hypothetical protein LBE31_02530, partial [Deltaproteobacteria bacterium]|nr:hypothetical protein [Deltaproteobacteria bacterium]